MLFIVIDKKMPPVRRQNIGRRTRNESRVHNLRDNETEEELGQRLEAKRMRISQARSTTNPEGSIPSTSSERQENRRSKSNSVLSYWGSNMTDVVYAEVSVLSVGSK